MAILATRSETPANWTVDQQIADHEAEKDK